jgi:hypothetical protein
MLFCYKISNEFPKNLKTNISQIINITHISLQNSISNNKINCFIEYKNESFKICSLQKNYKEEYSCLISFKINKNDEFKLKIDGDNNTKVNFIGYINNDVEDEIKLLENVNEEKKIKKEKNNKKELIDSDDDDILSENENVEIEELLNKKRKENPQDIKPIILNNLNDNNTKNYNLNKSQKKNKNLKNKKNNNKNNTILNK